MTAAVTTPAESAKTNSPGGRRDKANGARLRYHRGERRWLRRGRPKMLAGVVVGAEERGDVEEIDDAVVVEIAVGVAGRLGGVVLVAQELSDIEEIDAAVHVGVAGED
jgi:hypothetical protein